MKHTELIELGREIERKEHEKSSHLIVGWACVSISFIFAFITDFFKMGLYGGIVLLVFGILNLFVGYSEKKELEKLKNGISR